MCTTQARTASDFLAVLRMKGVPDVFCCVRRQQSMRISAAHQSFAVDSLLHGPLVSQGVLVGMNCAPTVALGLPSCSSLNKVGAIQRDSY